MIHELRIYTFRPGAVPEYLRLVEEVGRPIRGESCGRAEGSWISESGPLNQVWHLWSFPDLNQRQRLRGELARNAAWTNEFVAAIKPLLQRQEVRLMHPQIELRRPQGAGNIYEFRIYRARVADGPAFCRLLQDVLPARERYSQVLGLWQVDAPQPHEVAHLWVYPDLAARTEARARALQDPEWQAYLPKAQILLEEMTSTLLLPVPFSSMT